MPIRIGIVDEHEIVREGLKVFLETDDNFVFVGEASVPDDVLLLCERTRPDVLLFDFLTGYDCHALLHTLYDHHPTLKILLLTTNLNAKDVVAAVDAGVHGYLFKQLGIDELSDAIRAVHAGDRAFDREVEEVMASRSPSLRSHFFNFAGLLALGMGILPIGHTHLTSRD